MNKKRILCDAVLILTLLAAAIAAVLIIRAGQSEGGTVTVSKNGELICQYPLSEDGEYIIADESASNVLVIENGRAYIREASCPDKLCVNLGKISRTGERIICLPNKIIVEIVGESEEICQN